jgi:hypothetical protein
MPSARSRRRRCAERHRKHHQRAGNQLPDRSRRRRPHRLHAGRGLSGRDRDSGRSHTTDPLIANGRPYTIRVRLGDEHRASLEAIQNTVFNSSSGHTAPSARWPDIEQLPPQNEIRRENLQRLVVVTGRLEGSDLGSA